VSRNEITLVYYADAADARRIRVSTRRVGLALGALAAMITVPSFAAWHYAQQAAASDAALAAINAGHCPESASPALDDEDVGDDPEAAQTDAAAAGGPKRAEATPPERTSVVGP
jgi:hypothetical protein